MASPLSRVEAELEVAWNAYDRFVKDNFFRGRIGGFYGNLDGGKQYELEKLRSTVIELAVLLQNSKRHALAVNNTQARSKVP